MKAHPENERLQKLAPFRSSSRRTLVSVLIVLFLLSIGIAVALAKPNSGEMAFVKDPASLVNPFIGTTASDNPSSGSITGNTNPGPVVPFGMIQWGPDTTPEGPLGGSYDYKDSLLAGFSLSHLSGCLRCAAVGSVPILPVVGDIGPNPTAATQPLNHDEESAEPGYYQLTAGGVITELTSTTRSGMAQFTFPGSTSSNLLFKLSGTTKANMTTQFQVESDKEIKGSMKKVWGANEYTLHFNIVFDKPFAVYGSWKNAAAQGGKVKFSEPVSTGTMGTQSAVSGEDGVYITFDTTSDRTVKAKIGISYVSQDNAKLNREKENPGWSFVSVKNAAFQAWNKMLGKIRIGGGSETDQTIFYTALYHALLHPNVYNDVNGEYKGFDRKVHKVAEGHSQYANYDGWGIYRSEIQLLAMLAPQEASDMIASMLSSYDQTGMLPKWSSNNQESYVMVGDPAAPIIASAYAFGARDFDAQKALDAMVKQATVTNNIRPGLDYYASKGYLPSNGKYGCCNWYGWVPTQLEYNAADFSVSQLAAALGQTQVVEAFAVRANNWQNSFNPASGFLQPKKLSGQFQPGFQPDSSYWFVEGNTYIYTPMLPFNVKGIIAAKGGNKAFVDYLDGLTSDVTGMGVTQIQMKNQISYNIPWQFVHAGAPYKTQKVVRDIQEHLFTNSPGGLPGNDDQGSTSSWYVWSALGFYPVTPGAADVILGSPLFPKMEIELGNGGTIIQSAPAAAPNAPYVQQLTWNGVLWTKAYLPEHLFTSKSKNKKIKLDWTLSTEPNPAWGSGADDAPASNSRGMLTALGYLGSGPYTNFMFLRPGSAAALELGVQSMIDNEQKINWTVVSENSGLLLSEQSGTIQVQGGAKASQTLTVQVPSGTAHGVYLVTFKLKAADGTMLPDVVVEIGVDPYYNNKGISDDAVRSEGNFDGSGFSYSKQALQGVKLVRGAAAQYDGVHYVWPDVDAGTPDNMVPDGQTINFPEVAGAAKLGFIGAAAGGDTSGRVTFVYSDGSTQTAELGLTDWFQRDGKPLAYGNKLVASMPYRNVATERQLNEKVQLVSAIFTIDSSKALTGIILPASPEGSKKKLHIFAIGTDQGPIVLTP